MKYTTEIEIDLPRDRVVELFDNPDNMKLWQPGFVSMSHKEGEPGKEGAKSDLVYQMGKRRIEMVETIAKRNLPDEFTAIYETKGMWNEVQNLFVEIDEGKRTKWIGNTEFKASGLMMKLFMVLMPGAFKKQSMTIAMAFKEFAEG